MSMRNDCPEVPKAIGNSEFSLQNLEALASLLGMTGSLGEHCAFGLKTGAVKVRLLR